MASARPLIIGHRGAPGYRPEHTRSSYELAFELGADAVEPDVVPTRDGVLVVRHENEISETTDVAHRPEFADRRTRKVIEGREVEGWFTEDFTWAELETVRARERLPHLRASSASFDGQQPILRLVDVLDLVRRASLESGHQRGVVIELKHASHFLALGFDLAALVEADLRRCRWAESGLPLTIESFELGVLDDLRARGCAGSLVFLVENSGTPADLVRSEGEGARPYRWWASAEGLDALRDRVTG